MGEIARVEPPHEQPPPEMGRVRGIRRPVQLPENEEKGGEPGKKVEEVPPLHNKGQQPQLHRLPPKLERGRWQ